MINLSKLSNVAQKSGKIEAQCPACHQAGADSKGNHLVVYPDGNFGCVANPGDKEHNKAILKLVGEKGVRPPPQLEIRRQVIPESKVVLKLGRSGQKNPTPTGPSDDQSPMAPMSAASTKSDPDCPGPEQARSEKAR